MAVFIVRTSGTKTSTITVFFYKKKKSMCKSLYFLVGKVADCVNFVSALLLEAQSTPFQITPSTMANIVKGLYTLRPGKKEKCLY